MGDNRIEKLKQQLRDISNSMKLKLGPYLNIKIMRAFNSATKQKSLMALLILLVSLAKVNYTYAQPPDCVSGNVAYTIFNDSIGSSFSSTLDSMELRSVNLLTGAVGPLIGGHRYWVRKYDGTGLVTDNANYIYGSSALAIDFATSRFYVMTQMSAALPKDIMTINPLTGVMTIIATLPASMDEYHFVKMAGHNNNGYIYAIGVKRDTTSGGGTQLNPVLRFQTCGATPTAGCATASVQILGYLPQTAPTMNGWQLFNGDIAFDYAGNLFFATAAFERAGTPSMGKYTNARLFKINAASLPTSAGSGTIPMTLISDYNTLDSTVINGIGFNGAGNMFLTTRRYLGPQAPTMPPFKNELYSSNISGTATVMIPFTPPTPGTSASDLATCYFPGAILAKFDVRLSGQNVSGNSSLKWEVVSNNEVQYFEVEKSRDGSNFETISRVEVSNPDQSSQKYSYTDASAENGAAKYYRIRQVTQAGVRFYSNIVKLNGNKISLNSNVKPNPFVNQVELSVQLATANNIKVRITSQSGAVLFQRSYKGNAGTNNITIAELANFKPGVYILELNSDNEIIREKIIKQ